MRKARPRTGRELEERLFGALQQARFYLSSHLEKFTASGGEAFLKDVSFRGAGSLLDNIHGLPPRVLEEWTANLVRDAQGGFDGARHVAAHIISRGDRLPDALRDYVVDFLKTPKLPARKKRGKRSLTARDIHIAQIIHWICIKYGFQPLRNAATREAGEHESGCSIVAAALKSLNIHMDESSVERIWKKRK